MYLVFWPWFPFVDLRVWCPRKLHMAAVVGGEAGAFTAMFPPRSGRELRCSGLSTSQLLVEVGLCGGGRDRPHHHLGKHESMYKRWSSTKWVSGVLADNGSDIHSEDSMSRNGAESPPPRSAYFYSE